MSIRVYKIDNENYALVDSLEAEKVKEIDDLKSQNLLYSVAGAALAIPAVIVTSGALATIMTAAGIYMTVETMLNTERIRELEGKDIDFMYVLNQGLAVPGVLFPVASLAARGMQKAATVVQTFDGAGTGYALATGPLSVALAVPDLYNDRKRYYIDRGEDLTYEQWRTALRYRFDEAWRGPSSDRRDALRMVDQTSIIGAFNAVPANSSDAANNMRQTSTADTLFDFDGNAIQPGWLDNTAANPFNVQNDYGWNRYEVDSVIFKVSTAAAPRARRVREREPGAFGGWTGRR